MRTAILKMMTMIRQGGSKKKKRMSSKEMGRKRCSVSRRMLEENVLVRHMACKFVIIRV